MERKLGGIYNNGCDVVRDKHFEISRKQGSAAGDAGGAGRACSYKLVFSCRGTSTSNPGTTVCVWGEPDTTYVYAHAQAHSHTVLYPTLLSCIEMFLKSSYTSNLRAVY